MSKKQVTFTSQPMVWFDIRGAVDNRPSEYPRVRLDDKNVIQNFMKWLCDQTFFPARMQMTGGGQWLGAFWPEDAETVKKYLEEHGAGLVTRHPGRKP